MPSYVPSGELYFSALRVPTIDGTRIGHLLALLEAESCPVLLVGGTGVGKTAMVRDWLREEEDRRGIKGTNVSINYYTDSKRLQDQLEVPLERRGGQVGYWCCLFV
jgi:Cdc6-like AAA superfamily ATPase